MEVTEDEVVNAIRWMLGIPVDGNVGRSPEIWNRLSRSPDPAHRAQIDRICRCLAELMEQMMRQRLQLPGVAAEDTGMLESLWIAFARWLKENETGGSPRVSRLLKEAVFGRKPSASAPARTQPTQPVRPAPTAVPPRPVSPPVVVAPPPPAPVPPRNDMPSPEPPARPAPQWLYRPVPEQEPEPHAESAAVALQTAAGLRVVGARVRGKKHKHEGTNCDDWFEVRTVGPWTVTAVSDGAGSRRFSRIGARASCQKAVQVLAGCLADLPVPITPAAVLLARDEAGAFVNPPVAVVQDGLHRAFLGAREAVQIEAARLGDRPDCHSLLGRPVAFDDLSATLLVAVHAPLPAVGPNACLVVACQVGDGAVAGLAHDGNVYLLGEADSGEFSGETEFLTSRRPVEPANLLRRTFALVGDLRALMVMTDGVADDYFPAVPHLARLYADLALNGIVGAPAAGPERADPADADADSMGPDGPVRLRLRSATAYAAAVNVAPERLAADPALLRTGATGAGLTARTSAAEERLRLWLDAYHVRGSFDDRTLVVLEGERHG